MSMGLLLDELNYVLIALAVISNIIEALTPFVLSFIKFQYRLLKVLLEVILCTWDFN